MRLSQRETTAQGAVVTRPITGPGIVVRLKHIDGMKPADVRRSFARFCLANKIIVTAVEFSEGQFSPRTGKPIPGSEALPSAFQCVGNPEELSVLVNYFAVGEWHFALNVPTPRAAQGSGPEKVRPSLGSAFGQPAQIQATAVALAKDRTNAIRASNASGTR